MTWCNLTLMDGGGGREWLHSSDDLCKTRSHLPSHLPSCRNHAVASLNPSRRCQTRACWDLLHVSVMLDYLPYCTYHRRWGKEHTSQKLILKPPIKFGGYRLSDALLTLLGQCSVGVGIVHRQHQASVSTWWS